jgi:Tfp pilus assembly protein PilO
MVKKESQFEEYKYAALMIGGGILVAILLVSLIGIPIWKDMQKNTATAKARQDEYKMLSDKLENLKKLSEKEKELKEKNAKVLAALPEDKDVSRLFVQFENIATQSGLTVKQVSEGGAAGTATQAPASTTTGDIIPVVYQVSATSKDYNSLKTALTNFEKALRIVSIDSFDVTNGESGMNINFNITTYKRGAK